MANVLQAGFSQVAETCSSLSPSSVCDCLIIEISLYVVSTNDSLSAQREKTCKKIRGGINHLFSGAMSEMVCFFAA